jgi:hypothetical protein
MVQIHSAAGGRSRIESVLRIYDCHELSARRGLSQDRQEQRCFAAGSGSGQLGDRPAGQTIKCLIQQWDTGWKKLSGYLGAR